MSAQYITPNKDKVKKAHLEHRGLYERECDWFWFQSLADSPGSSSSSPYTPMSERQQLAMIKQMTEQTSTPDKSGNSHQSR